MHIVVQGLLPLFVLMLLLHVYCSLIAIGKWVSRNRTTFFILAWQSIRVYVSLNKDLKHSWRKNILPHVPKLEPCTKLVT